MRLTPYGSPMDLPGKWRLPASQPTLYLRMRLTPYGSPMDLPGKWRLPASQPTLYLRMLALFSTYAQRVIPYRVPGVDSNDVLYASEPEYAAKLQETIGPILPIACR